MAKRDFSFADRDAQDRELLAPPVPTHFTISEISGRFAAGIGSVYEQIDTAERLMSEGDGDACESILRAQVVQSESLLDFFLHEVTKYCLFQMFTARWEKTKQYGNLPMTLGRAEEGIYASNNEDWFFGYVNEHFSWRVMLSPESISDQLKLLGLRASDIFKDALPDLIDGPARKQRIKELFLRRNEIAHQDDRSHKTAMRNPIDARYVRQYVKDVQSLGVAVAAAVEAKESGSIQAS